MLAQITVGSGGTAVTTTLADDTNSQAGGKLAFTLGDFTFDSIAQVNPLFRGARPFKAARGNVDTKLAFSGAVSLTSRGAVLTFLKTLQTLVNTACTLTLVDGAVTMTCANAILKSARRDPSLGVGVRIGIQYHFEIDTIA
jgi:hypothetical protein